MVHWPVLPYDAPPKRAWHPRTAKVAQVNPKIRKIVLKPKKALPFFAHHPWVLDTAISIVEPGIENGDEVDLVTDKGAWIARGLFNSNSRIRVRLYSWQEGESLDAEFWRRRITSAAELRKRLGLPDSPDGAARLVFSEADFLGGLVVDSFAGHLVAQINSLAIFRRVGEIREILQQVFSPASISFRADEATAKREGLDPLAVAACGDSLDGPVTIVEHALNYQVDLSSGQKTGFFADQRENRRHVARYARDARVLDMCCYTGGFGLAAVKLGHARNVTGIDTSVRAIEQARENAQRNGIDCVEYRAGDMFQSLEELARSGETYDLVILDPPRFVRSRTGIDQALRAYHRLNLLGMQLCERGGFLATCSCSGNISRQMFEEVLVGASQRSKREIQILEHHGPSPDHPVAGACPETRYLKCVICRVL